MKKLLLFSCLLLSVLAGQAQQVINYDSNGNDEKSASDILVISLEKNTKSTSAAAGITGVIAPVVGLAIDLINAKIASNKLKYTASYSNQVTFRVGKVVYSDLVSNAYDLHLKRYKLNQLTDAFDNSNLMADYGFEMVNFGADFIQLRLTSVNLVKSKAKVKNINDNLTVTIDLTISTSTAPAAKDTGKTKTSSNEAIVKIPLVKPGAKITQSFLTINDAIFPGIAAPDKGTLLLTVAATVKEVNTDRLDPTAVESFLKNNAADINSLIKTIFPGAGK